MRSLFIPIMCFLLTLFFGLWIFLGEFFHLVFMGITLMVFLDSMEVGSGLGSLCGESEIEG